MIPFLIFVVVLAAACLLLDLYVDAVDRGREWHYVLGRVRFLETQLQVNDAEDRKVRAENARLRVRLAEAEQKLVAASARRAELEAATR